MRGPKIVGFLLSNNSLFPTGICCSVLPAYLKETCSKINQCQSSHLEVFLGEGVLKICSKFTGEHPCRSVYHRSVTHTLSNFIEIALWRGCSPVNLLYIFRTPFPKSTSIWLLLSLLFASLPL